MVRPDLTWTLTARWRTGRKVGRTIYAIADHGWQQDTLIGVMDTSELAHHVVGVHNAHMRAQHP